MATYPAVRDPDALGLQPVHIRSTIQGQQWPPGAPVLCGARPTAMYGWVLTNAVVTCGDCQKLARQFALNVAGGQGENSGPTQ
jgi:hypothetical protein